LLLCRLLHCLVLSKPQANALSGFDVLSRTILYTFRLTLFKRLGTKTGNALFKTAFNKTVVHHQRILYPYFLQVILELDLLRLGEVLYATHLEQLGGRRGNQLNEKEINLGVLLFGS